MAATGAYFGGVCYSTVAAATDAYYSEAAPVLSAGNPAYLVQYGKASGSWKVYTYSMQGGVRTLEYSLLAPVPGFAACDPAEKFLDGQAIGWGISTAMVAVAALMLARRGARSG